jgi:hypothetical protein
MRIRSTLAALALAAVAGAGATATATAADMDTGGVAINQVRTSGGDPLCRVHASILSVPLTGDKQC